MIWYDITLIYIYIYSEYIYIQYIVQRWRVPICFYSPIWNRCASGYRWAHVLPNSINHPQVHTIFMAWIETIPMGVVYGSQGCPRPRHVDQDPESRTGGKELVCRALKSAKTSFWKDRITFTSSTRSFPMAKAQVCNWGASSLACEKPWAEIPSVARAFLYPANFQQTYYTDLMATLALGLKNNHIEIHIQVRQTS